MCSYTGQMHWQVDNTHLMYLGLSLPSIRETTTELNKRHKIKRQETFLLGQAWGRCIAAELHNILRQYTGGRGLLAARLLDAKQHIIQHVGVDFYCSSQMNTLQRSALFYYTAGLSSCHEMLSLSVRACEGPKQNGLTYRTVRGMAHIIA